MGSLFSSVEKENKEPSAQPPQVEKPGERQDKEIHNRACFGAGCYWGTEKFFKIDFARKMYPESLIKKDFVGFMGPKDAKKNPTYKEVCNGDTGHIEVYDFQYSGGEEMFERLVRFFFQFHDPTTLNAQQGDVGRQYASIIYCYDDKQKDIANKVIGELQQLINAGKITCYKEDTVKTEVLPVTEFFEAHDEHQEYLMKNPNGYCSHRVRFKEWPTLD